MFFSCPEFSANVSIRSSLIKLSRHPLTGNYVLSLNPLIYPHNFIVILLQRDPQRGQKRKTMLIFQFGK